MKDIQKQKSRTDAAGAYATTSTQRSSQVVNGASLQKHLSKSNQKNENRQTEPKHSKNTKSSYVSGSQTARYNKQDFRSPNNAYSNQKAHQQSTRANTQSIIESQIVPEDREKLINFSTSLSRIEQIHNNTSPSIDGTTIQAIDNKYSNDQSELNNLLRVAIQQNMTNPGSLSNQEQIGFSANQPPLDPEPAPFFTDLSRLPDFEDDSGIDLQCYSHMLQNAERM